MKFIVEENSVRLDSFLAQKTSASRSQIKNVLESEGAVVNGIKRTKSGLELKAGDTVEFALPSPTTLDVSAENIPVEIIFQDEYFAVVNKPKGMVVHPATSYKKNDTLVNALLYSLDNLSSINGVIRPGIVHRIDKDTSGLLVVAKNDEAHKNLAEQIEKKSAGRVYVALCDGNFKEDEGSVDAPVGRNKKDRKKMCVTQDGRRAVTHYRVLERFGKYTLVRFELETGRTHQIRVHAAYLHHPVTADEVYGGSSALYKNGQLLHAKELYLRHPHTGEEMKFECDLPDYFKSVLEKLRKQFSK